MIDTLNKYFEYVANSVISNGGVIEKFNGDSVIAVFGFKNKPDNSSVSACNAAILSYKKYKNLSPEIELSIGIHKGPVIYGFFGSDEHLEFMTIGDARNLVSRILPLNSIYDTGILISETVRNEISMEYVVREVMSIPIKGKRNTLKIFELRID